MGKQKGDAKTGGRQKGTPNKITSSAREAFQFAFDTIGGHQALAEWAKNTQDEFYKLYARLIPQDINHGGQPDNPVLTKNPDETLKKTNTLLEKLNARIKSLGETGK